MSNFNRIDLNVRSAVQAAVKKEYTSVDAVININKSASSVYREIINNSYIKKGRKTCV